MIFRSGGMNRKRLLRQDSLSRVRRRNSASFFQALAVPSLLQMEAGCGSLLENLLRKRRKRVFRAFSRAILMGLSVISEGFRRMLRCTFSSGIHPRPKKRALIYLLSKLDRYIAKTHTRVRRSSGLSLNSIAVLLIFSTSYTCPVHLLFMAMGLHHLRRKR